MVGKGEMRDPMTKKFVLLPFSISCVSQASVAVLEQRARRSRSDFRSSSLGSHEEEEEGEERILGESMRHSSRFSRPNLSNGVNRLMKGFKSLSQLFNEDEMEELGMEMEIGCPTDVKHVTHIGWDSLITNSNAISLKQFQSPTSPALETNLQTFGKTRDKMENFLLVPITMGCVSQANVDVGGQHTLTRSKSDLASSSSGNQLVEDVEESISCEGMRHSSRPNISTGVNRLMKGFKSLSQLFVYEDEMEEMGMEMEIGCPTDVKHVTHIGSDGLATNINPLMEWDKVIIPELLSQSSMNKFKLPASATVN